MKISNNLKVEIQSFCYFIFKGTLSSKLIFSDIDYVKYLLNNPNFLYSCFEIFAFLKNENPSEDPSEKIGDYILCKIQNQKTINVKAYNLNDLWKDFLTLSKRFCYNEFPIKVNNFEIKDLNGCGTDAVPYFAVWTNVVEIDENFAILNSEYALRRANERLTTLNNFKDWEIEQELY